MSFGGTFLPSVLPYNVSFNNKKGLNLQKALLQCMSYRCCFRVLVFVETNLTQLSHWNPGCLHSAESNGESFIIQSQCAWCFTEPKKATPCPDGAYNLKSASRKMAKVRGNGGGEKLGKNMCAFQ